MAAREIFSILLGDGDKLVVVDAVTGDIGVSEMNAMRDLNNLYVHPDADKVWLQLYGDGGRVAAYLGDGLLGDPATDYSPSDYNHRPSTPDYPQHNYPPFPVPTTAVAYYQAADTFVFATQDNDPYFGSGFVVKNGAGATLYSSPSGNLNFNHQMAAPYQGFIGASVSFYNGAVQNGWLEGNSYYHFSTLTKTGDNQGSVCLVRWDWDAGQNNFVFNSVVQDFGHSPNGDSITEYSPVIALENGDKYARTSWYQYAKLSAGSLTWLPMSFDQVTGSPALYDIGAIKSAFAVGNAKAVNYQFGGDAVAFFDAVQNGLAIATLSRVDLSLSTTHSAPLSGAFPHYDPTAVNGFDYDMEWIDGSSNNAQLWVLNTVNTVADGFVPVQKGIVVSLDDPTYSKPFDLAKFYATLDCPKASWDMGEVVRGQMQAYEVTGVTQHDGAPVSTELALIDNVSKRIVGRTISDPTTGAYKFRCWSNRPKAVIAKHPVDGGWRLAADRVPVAVG